MATTEVSSPSCSPAASPSVDDAQQAAACAPSFAACPKEEVENVTTTTITTSDSMQEDEVVVSSSEASPLSVPSPPQVPSRAVSDHTAAPASADASEATTAPASTSDTTTATPAPAPSLTIDEHLTRLRTEFSDLLLDTMGDTRLAFLPAPSSVTSLLAEAWNKATGAVPGSATATSTSANTAMSTATSSAAATTTTTSTVPAVIDRIDGKLQAVQSYFPNLMNYLLASPGFPTAASGAADSIIFASFGPDRVQEAQDDLLALLHLQLCEMRHADYTQRLLFYLSFMKTRQAASLQDAHVDFQWHVVNPFQQLANDENAVSVDTTAAAASATAKESSYQNNMATTSSSSNRRSRSSSSRSRNNNTRGRKRIRRLPYKKRVPFVALFPLTKAGMTLEIWEARGIDHRPTATDGEKDLGRLVHLPFGTMVVMRGDVLHAGGFMNDTCSGDPRAHLYIYREDGELHDLNNKNTYDLPVTAHVQWAAAAAQEKVEEEDDRAQAATLMVESKHQNKNIVPFSRLYRHHPQRLLLVRQHDAPSPASTTTTGSTDTTGLNSTSSSVAAATMGE